MLQRQWFFNWDLVGTHLLLGSEGERQAEEKKENIKKKKSRKKKQRETTEETWGRIMTKREGNGVGMKKEDQSGWFGSKCYILKTVRAEIEKQNQQKKEKLLQAEGVP